MLARITGVVVTIINNTGIKLVNMEGAASYHLTLRGSTHAGEAPV